jgi:hypothetical protein
LSRDLAEQMAFSKTVISRPILNQSTSGFKCGIAHQISRCWPRFVAQFALLNNRFFSPARRRAMTRSTSTQLQATFEWCVNNISDVFVMLVCVTSLSALLYYFTIKFRTLSTHRHSPCGMASASPPDHVDALAGPDRPKRRRKGTRLSCAECRRHGKFCIIIDCDNLPIFID